MVLPPPRSIPPSPGGQLAPEDVIGRDLDIERAWQRLDRASVRLNEPRRLGKTSVLTKMSSSPPPGWICVRRSFQGVETVEGMVSRALSAIYQHQHLSKRVRDRVKQFLSSSVLTAEVDGVTLRLTPSVREEPLVALEAALHDVAGALGGARLLLAWDEVPDMVLDVMRTQGVDQAAHLLATLRRFRDEDPDSPLRWLLTGSIGMHHVLRGIDRGDSLVNDLDNLPLGPLTEQWSCWLAECLFLGAGIEYDQQALVRLTEASGGIPYLSHLVVQYARDAAVPTVRGSDVDELFERAVGDLDHSHQSTHFLSRVDRYYGKDTAAAEWLLDQLARQPATRDGLRQAARAAGRRLPADPKLRELLSWLCQDHYLDKHPTYGTYRWRYEPLRRVWQIRRS
jgi:hypothetical protein